MKWASELQKKNYFFVFNTVENLSEENQILLKEINNWGAESTENAEKVFQ